MVGARGFEPPTTWPPVRSALVRPLPPCTVFGVRSRILPLAAPLRCRRVSPDVAPTAGKTAGTASPRDPRVVRRSAQASPQLLRAGHPPHPTLSVVGCHTCPTRGSGRGAFLGLARCLCSTALPISSIPTARGAPCLPCRGKSGPLGNRLSPPWCEAWSPYSCGLPSQAASLAVTRVSGFQIRCAVGAPQEPLALLAHPLADRLDGQDKPGARLAILLGP